MWPGLFSPEDRSTDDYDCASHELQWGRAYSARRTRPERIHGVLEVAASMGPGLFSPEDYTHTVWAYCNCRLQWGRAYSARRTTRSNFT